MITFGKIYKDKDKHLIGIESALQAIPDRTMDGKKVFGTSFAVIKDNFIWLGASGKFSKDQPYFIASTTKPFTTSIILRLKSVGCLFLEDRISKYLDKAVLQGLHIYQGIDYSEALTIKHLLAHTSGLPDYFQEKGSNGKSLEDAIRNGGNQFWTFDQAMEGLRQ